MLYTPVTELMRMDLKTFIDVRVALNDVIEQETKAREEAMKQ